MIAVCFCGAAKTTSLGIPLATAMWTQSDDLTRALIQIPVLLYTIEQVFMAQILVYVFKWYLRRAAKAEGDEEGGSVGSGGVSVAGQGRGEKEGDRSSEKSTGERDDEKKGGEVKDGNNVVPVKTISET